MKYFFIGLVVLLVVGVTVFLYFRYFTKNSPSIMGGGYDEKMQEEQLQNPTSQDGKNILQ